MKTIGGPLDTHIAGETTTIATRFKLTRSDGVVLGFTDHEEEVIIGGVTYKTSIGDNPSAITSTSSLSVDNLEVMAIIDDVRLIESELLGGLYDYAVVEIAEFNYSDLSQGEVIFRAGVIGEQVVGRGQVRVELRGVMQVLQQTIGRMHLKRCDADVGDTRCKVRLSPPTWLATTAYTVRPAKEAGLGSVVKPTSFNDRHFKCTTAGTSGGSEPSWNTTIGGTTADGSVVWTTIEALTVLSSVATVTDRGLFTTAAIARADGWFDGGLLTWTSGLNNGIRCEVKRWVDSTNTIQLHLSVPYTIAVSDTFTVTVGCDQLRDTCVNKFDNMRNNRGFYDMPTRDAVLAYPDSPI